MLKKIIVVLVLAQGYILAGQAQTAHKPAELLQMVHESKLDYQIGNLYIDVPDPDYSNLINKSNIYQDDSDGQTILKRIKLSKGAKPEWDNGEYAFKDGNNYKDAIKHFRNVLDSQPDYYPAKIQMAKVYEKEGDYEKAEASYKQAMSIDYIDYMPHKLIAEDYLKEKKYDEAVNEITIASILNRDDTSVLADMNEIYDDAKLKFEDWVFTPQYKLFKGQKENEIEVLSHKGWSGYALAKAIWKFKPGYAQSQGEKPGINSVLQEKECLQLMLSKEDQHVDAKKPKSIAELEKAQKYKMLDGFIYYEILLPKEPSLAYELPRNVISRIKNYVIMGRGGEDPKKK